MPFQAAFSAGIQNLTFTEVVKDCIIINAATKAETPAKSGDVLVPPNVLKTGADSRAELVAEDKTVTRVGANTIFSVEADSRDVNIAQGSVLFASPKGRGGGRIKSAGATASVLGTTMLVGANQSGGFKVMLLEGKGEVKGAKGGAVALTPGQMSFALPGKAPSPPVNFELKGQVGGSKLVGGFSKPLASIAKIEAAVSVQNVKISKGALSSTGLLLGDRPDAAFPLELSNEDLMNKLRDQIEMIIYGRILGDSEELADINKISRAYQAAMARSLNLTQSVAPASSTNPYINSDAETYTDLIFNVDGSGRTSKGLVPKTIPGDRETGGFISMLIGNDISINLSPINASTPNFFLQSPLQDAKNRTAIVALNDLSLMSNIEFAGFDKIFTNEDGTTLGTPLILSAGHSLIIAPGSQIRATTSLFEIYVAGPGYAANLELSEGFRPKLPLQWDSVSLINEWPTEANSPTGLTRIKAPSIELKNTAIQSGEIAIESDGAISAANTGRAGRISTVGNVSKVSFASAADLTGLAVGQLVIGEGIPDGTTILAINSDTREVTLSKTATSTATPKPVYARVPLGIERPEDLRFCAPKITVASSGNSVSLSNVYFTTDDGLFSAAEGLTLSGVSISSMDFQTDQKLKSLAGGDISVTGSSFTASVESEFNSTAGMVTLLDSVFGSGPLSSETLVEETAPKTSFAVGSFKDMVLTGAEVNADKIDLRSEGSITVTGGKFAQTDSLKGWFKAEAKKGVSVESSAISALVTSILAGTDILLKQSIIQAPQSNIPESIFSAQATTGSITLRYGIVDAANVTLNAKGEINIDGIDARSRLIAREVNIVSKTGDIIVKDTDFYLRTKPDETVPSTLNISMLAANQILLDKANLSSAQKTTLDAATVVLRDVTFGDGSFVYLNSTQGLVAAQPGSFSSLDKVVAGQVNILTGVKYGTTTIALPNQTSPMNNTQFKDAVNTTLGISRDAFTIGTHVPTTPTAPAKP